MKSRAVLLFAAALMLLCQAASAGTIRGDAAHRSIGAEAIELCWRSPRACAVFSDAMSSSRADLCPDAKKAAQSGRLATFADLRAELKKDQTNVVRADFASCKEDVRGLLGALCVNYVEGGSRGMCAYVTAD